MVLKPCRGIHTQATKKRDDETITALLFFIRLIH